MAIMLFYYFNAVFFVYSSNTNVVSSISSSMMEASFQKMLLQYTDKEEVRYPDFENLISR